MMLMLVKIYTANPSAKVELIVLSERFPPPNSNSNFKKGVSKFILKLPRTHFLWDSSTEQFIPSEEKYGEIERRLDTYYIIANAPVSQSADVYVLPPLPPSELSERYESIVRVIQAKKYLKPYNPSEGDVLKEIAKLGLDERMLPITYHSIQKLLSPFVGCKIEHSFVLSSSGAPLISKLQSNLVLR